MFLYQTKFSKVENSGSTFETECSNDPYGISSKKYHAALHMIWMKIYRFDVPFLCANIVAYFQAYPNFYVKYANWFF